LYINSPCLIPAKRDLSQVGYINKSSGADSKGVTSEGPGVPPYPFICYLAQRRTNNEQASDF